MAGASGRDVLDASTVPLEEMPDRIGRWLGSGTLQADDGAFCGWLDQDSGLLSPPYPEITGYAVGFLSDAAQPQPAARRAARCLVLRWRAGERSARPEKTGAAVYTFDIAMQAHGLIRYGRAAGDADALEVGLEAAAFLVGQIGEHKSLPPIVPGTGAGAPAPSTWSTTGRVHLLKALQALLSAHDLGLAGAGAAAGRLVREALRGEEGVPPATCPDGDVLSLHALCYAAEGLWAWGVHQDDAAALGRSRAIAEWVWRRRLPDGGVPGFVRAGKGPLAPEPQLDATAQAIRLASLHGFADPRAEAGLLAAGAWHHGPYSAVRYRPRGSERHLNTWASMFAAQALRLCDGSRPGLQWWELV